jgi:hypothetical protein
MPYAYLFQCQACGFDVELIGAKEFYLTPEGERTDYEYPAPDTYEWPVKRVSGLWNRVWCPACRDTRNLVIAELPEPAEHPVQVFLLAEAEGRSGDEVGPCPVCGAATLNDLEDLPCPRCDTGRLTMIGEYEP